jgi:hypothetical protein
LRCSDEAARRAFAPRPILPGFSLCGMPDRFETLFRYVLFSVTGIIVMAAIFLLPGPPMNASRQKQARFRYFA